jgi:hypothetical protein
MRRHLYQKLKQCPGIINDIELTEEIKQKILENRVYIAPKIVKPKINVDLTQPDEGFIYIFYPRCCKNADESTYKIGKTADYHKRKNQYVKGGEFEYVIKVDNRHECENILKLHFKNEFVRRKDYGIEYFEGDIFEMVSLTKSILEDRILETAFEFKYMV